MANKKIEEVSREADQVRVALEAEAKKKADLLITQAKGWLDK